MIEALTMGLNILCYGILALSVGLLVLNYVKTDPSPAPSAVRIGTKTAMRIAAVAVASRLLLLIFSWSAAHACGSGRDILDTWTNWDANAYLYIADSGYFHESEGWIRLVFFPLYSSVIWLVNAVVTDVRISALLVSWGCLAGACVYLYKLVLLDWDRRAAGRAVKFLLIFPVTVFLGAPFSESMFVLLCLACLYYARLRQFARACALGALAALTRNVGVLLAIPVMIEMLVAHDFIPRYFKNGVKNRLKPFVGDAKFIFIIPMGTVIYLLLNHVATGDAFYFLKAQQAQWSQSFGSYANTLHVTFERTFAHDDLLRNKLTLWGSQLVVLLIGGLTLPMISRKMRVSYAAFAIVYLYMVFAPTWLLSGFRYYMALAVLYPAMALLTKNRWANIAITTVFIPLALAYAFCFSMHWQLM